MALSPTDKVPSIMESLHGTRCLITDMSSERYLEMHRKNKMKSVPNDSYSRWCGGKDGFDLYVERVHE